jgi:hypothetical protein
MIALLDESPQISRNHRAIRSNFAGFFIETRLFVDHPGRLQIHPEIYNCLGHREILPFALNETCLSPIATIEDGRDMWCEIALKILTNVTVKR